MGGVSERATQCVQVHLALGQAAVGNPSHESIAFSSTSRGLATAAAPSTARASQDAMSDS